MGTRIRFALWIILAILMSSFSVYADNDKQSAALPEGALVASEQALADYQDLIAQQYQTYSFNSAEEVRSTRLGRGFQVWGIDKKKLSSPAANKIMDIVSPTNQWAFLVELNGSPKTWITLTLKDGKYEFAGGGGDASLFTAAYATITAASETAVTLIQIHDKNFLVGEEPSTGEELVQPLEQHTVIGDDFVQKLKAQKLYNDKGEMLYGSAA
ncbi:hypothetical protein [Paenibacillus sp. MMS18-CY102]|uniref:hypothetical protein n=1 Tax=Paenibacillus sp. MMS18-CY102 TaxID=2682849 RepID=UPI001366587F|nr:hypothetical protein [Paenibacillus sp. MMS18-CY102]MWC31097.1 hypothetical protein [Paenibacillus sp. MMS18-CY102]